MGSLGATEILLIFLVILLLFGAKRIPEIARGLGRGIREFKDATSDIRRELDIDEPPRRIEPPRPPAVGAPEPRAEAHAARPDAERPDAEPLPPPEQP